MVWAGWGWLIACIFTNAILIRNVGTGSVALVLPWSNALPSKDLNTLPLQILCRVNYAQHNAAVPLNSCRKQAAKFNPELLHTWSWLTEWWRGWGKQTEREHREYWASDTIYPFTAPQRDKWEAMPPRRELPLLTLRVCRSIRPSARNTYCIYIWMEKRHFLWAQLSYYLWRR